MDGLLLINKPKGLTSRDVVNKVSHILNIKKIGHTGTLDPIATGVLVLCLGKATKIVDLITSYDKEYIAEVTLGIETDTLDIEGKIIKEKPVLDITENQIKEVLNSFIGSYNQEVPKYSAVKIKGKRLYEYARSNQPVDLPAREVNIYGLKLIDNAKTTNGKLKFKISCRVSKGTYIRSLIRDIGRKLNIPSCMSSLRRTKQGEFNIEDCNTLDDIEKGDYKLISINKALSHLSSIKVDKEMEIKINNGSILDRFFNEDKAVIINEGNNVIAIYQIYNKDDSKVKPYIML